MLLRRLLLRLLQSSSSSVLLLPVRLDQALLVPPDLKLGAARVGGEHGLDLPGLNQEGTEGEDDDNAAKE